MADLTSLINTAYIHPLLNYPINLDDFLMMDFSKTNEELEQVNLSNTKLFDEYVQNKIKAAQKKGGIGGYLEERIIYRRSPHFGAEEEARTIHLGIDVWLPAGTYFHSPLPAIVHSMADNNHFGDYGPTIILAHQLNGYTFYSLYGHLSRKSLSMVHEGQSIDAGEVFCELGDYPENGDWPPHLHIQLITDMLGKHGDFPGVCTKEDLVNFQTICLDPMLILR
jgi:peptidoglycan LD-endopeptidase LytH